MGDTSREFLRDAAGMIRGVNPPSSDTGVIGSSKDDASGPGWETKASKTFVEDIGGKMRRIAGLPALLELEDEVEAEE
jgi:hypothetical protein